MKKYFVTIETSAVVEANTPEEAKEAINFIAEHSCMATPTHGRTIRHIIGDMQPIKAVEVDD